MHRKLQPIREAETVWGKLCTAFFYDISPERNRTLVKVFKLCGAAFFGAGGGFLIGAGLLMWSSDYAGMQASVILGGFFFFLTVASILSFLVLERGLMTEVHWVTRTYLSVKGLTYNHVVPPFALARLNEVERKAAAEGMTSAFSFSETEVDPIITAGIGTGKDYFEITIAVYDKTLRQPMYE